MAEQTTTIPDPLDIPDQRCANCQREGAAVVLCCLDCFNALNKRVRDAKLRLSGDVDWNDIKKYGIYDRFGVPIATVLEVMPRVQVQRYVSTGPMSPMRQLNDELRLDIRPLKR